MGKTITELLAALPDWEYDIWAAYYTIEPFGGEWLQTARICATFAQYNGWTSTQVDEDTFMPGGYQPLEQRQDASYESFMIAAASAGIRIKPKPTGEPAAES